MSYLVDTNVISELARAQPDQSVVDWARDINTIAVSVVTVEEVSFGLSWRPNARVARWFERFFETRCEVIPLSNAIAERAGWLRGQLQGAGEMRMQADMFIAATAQLHGLVVVTRNERDFVGCAVPVLNPFSGVAGV